MSCGFVSANNCRSAYLGYWACRMGQHVQFERVVIGFDLTQRQTLLRCQAPRDSRQVWQFLHATDWNEEHRLVSGRSPEQIGASRVGVPLRSARDGKRSIWVAILQGDDDPDWRLCRKDGGKEKTWSLSFYCGTSDQVAQAQSETLRPPHPSHRWVGPHQRDPHG